MIDIVMNEKTGVTLVHDEPTLDGALSFDVERDTGEASIMLSDGQRRRLAPLAASVVSRIAAFAVGMVARMEGRSVASLGFIVVRAR